MPLPASPTKTFIGLLLGTDYSLAQMIYELRRLRLHGLIRRVEGTDTYVVTDQDIVAVFYTKLKNRQLAPLLEADRPPAPISVRRALATIEHSLDNYVAHARLGTAA